MQLYCGDCLQVMEQIPDKSIDMVLCDPPYGLTANKWDTPIPFDKMWAAYNRITKDNAAIVLFGQPPFSAALIMSNVKWFRYEWTWVKTCPVGFLNARRRPLRATENILVFCKQTPPYHPQMRAGKPYKKTKPASNTKNYNPFNAYVTISNGERYPTNVLYYSNQNFKHVHSTQKPVPLLEYLIKTYTEPGAVVLDNCMGSGSTGVACRETSREFIGIELDPQYFQIAKQRVNHETSETA